MNDEIKEILEQLEWYRKIGKKDVYYPECVLPNKKAFILLDYITNLQQENERLKDSRDWWQDRFFGQQEYDDSHRITAIEYKKRIDKAIEYIKSNPNVFYDENLIDVETLLNNEFTDEYVGEIRFISTLLNILQNGSEEK